MSCGDRFEEQEEDVCDYVDVDGPYRSFLSRLSPFSFVFRQEWVDIAAGILQCSTHFCHPITIPILRVHAIEHVVCHTHHQGIHLQPIIQPFILALIELPDLFILDLLQLCLTFPAFLKSFPVNTFFQLSFQLGMEIVMHGEVDGVAKFRLAARGGDGGFEVVGFVCGSVIIAAVGLGTVDHC